MLILRTNSYFIFDIFLKFFGSKLRYMSKGHKHTEAAPTFDKIVFSKVGVKQFHFSFIDIPCDPSLNCLFILTQKHLWYFKKLLWSKVKQGLGGNVRLILSGAAPLATHVESFLRVVTCAHVVQGYGMHIFFVWWMFITFLFALILQTIMLFLWILYGLFHFSWYNDDNVTLSHHDHVTEKEQKASCFQQQIPCSRRYYP